MYDFIRDVIFSEELFSFQTFIKKNQYSQLACRHSCIEIYTIR